MSPPDDSFALCLMVPDRIIPVIFVPGVMGSNLTGIGDASGVDWRVDSGLSAAKWMRRGARERKASLQPHLMEVDDRGKITSGTAQTDEELQRRGWGEIAAMSYGDALVWLENALNDFDDPQRDERVRLRTESLQAISGEEPLNNDEIALSYKYRFPVHACGYNWLDSNAVAAKRLGERIDAIIQRYQKERKRCEKVIIVTHSMGGLVARHCSEMQGYRDKIMGIVHGVMPAIGAAAVYRRFKAGTEGNFLTALVLGSNAAEMTAVLSSAPGPLQLLPTPEYGNNWLVIRDGAQEHSLPKNGDPYGEVYAVRGKWWSMCEDHLMNPLNTEGSTSERAAQTEADWIKFEETIHTNVKLFHKEIKEKYHGTTYAFYGSDARNRAYGTVTWTVKGGALRKATPDVSILDLRANNPLQIKRERTVSVPMPQARWGDSRNRTYIISQPDEDGDGTVPQRSGIALQPYCQSFLQVSVGHEPAFKASEGDDNLRACRFTLRAIVRIAQAARHSSLMRYE